MSGRKRKIDRNTATQGISIDPELLARAKAHAEVRRMSFSAYVQDLVAKDLGDAPRDAVDDRIRVMEMQIHELAASFGRTDRTKKT
jgi:hypothetical protein